MDFERLKAAALEILNPRKISEDIEAGGVAAALVTDRGTYTEAYVSTLRAAWAFCAEHAAIAAMITAGESRVEKILAVGWDKKIMPPLRQMPGILMQLGNPDCQVLVSETTVVSLKELLPYYWNSNIS